MRNLFLLCTFISICYSCSSIDDGFESTSLKGVWNLVEVECHCEPGIYQTGEHIWNFDVVNDAVAVVNNSIVPLQILDNGSYNYTLNTNTITILNVEYRYYFENNQLFLADSPESDGPLLRFIR